MNVMGRGSQRSRVSEAARMVARLEAHPRSVALSAARRLRDLVRESAGAVLLEAVISSTIFVTIAGTALIGLSTMQIARATLERQAIAENLARNQMEYIFSMAYQDPVYTYTTSTSPTDLVTTTQPQYVISAVATSTAEFPGDAKFSKIIVTITHEGRNALTLETFRAND